MRELRKIKGKRFKKGRNGLGRWILFLLIVCVVAGMGVIFTLSKKDTGIVPPDLSSGKIYVQDRQRQDDISPQGGGKTESEKPKGEAPVSPESFTFYKMLNSKKEDFVPLTGDTSKSDKRKEGEIRDPQLEKMLQMEKGIDQGMEKRVKKDIVYTVQVAALSNELLANEAISRLKSQGYVSYLIKEEAQKGAGLYKVRVGKFVSIVDAQEVAKLLKRDGFDTYVVKAE